MTVPAGRTFMRSGIISQYCCRLPAWTRASCLPSAQYPPVTEVPVPLACLYPLQVPISLEQRPNSYAMESLKLVGPNTGVDKAMGEVWKSRGQICLLPCVVLCAVPFLLCQNAMLWCLGLFNLLQCKTRGKHCLWITCLCWSGEDFREGGALEG